MSFISLGIMAMSASAGMVFKKNVTTTTRTTRPTVKPTTKAPPVTTTRIISPSVTTPGKITTKSKRFTPSDVISEPVTVERHL